MADAQGYNVNENSRELDIGNDIITTTTRLDSMTRDALLAVTCLIFLVVPCIVVSVFLPDVGLHGGKDRIGCLRLESVDNNSYTNVLVGTPFSLAPMLVTGDACGVIIWGTTKYSSASGVYGTNYTTGYRTDIMVIGGQRITVPVRYAERPSYADSTVYGILGICDDFLRYMRIGTRYASRCSKVHLGTDCPMRCFIAGTYELTYSEHTRIRQNRISLVERGRDSSAFSHHNLGFHPYHYDMKVSSYDRTSWPSYPGLPSRPWSLRTCITTSRTTKTVDTETHGDSGKEHDHSYSEEYSRDICDYPTVQHIPGFDTDTTALMIDPIFDTQPEVRLDVSSEVVIDAFSAVSIAKHRSSGNGDTDNFTAQLDIYDPYTRFPCYAIRRNFGSDKVTEQRREYIEIQRHSIFVPKRCQENGDRDGEHQMTTEHDIHYGAQQGVTDENTRGTMATPRGYTISDRADGSTASGSRTKIRLMQKRVAILGRDETKNVGVMAEFHDDKTWTGTLLRCVSCTDIDIIIIITILLIFIMANAWGAVYGSDSLSEITRVTVEIAIELFSVAVYSSFAFGTDARNVIARMSRFGTLAVDIAFTSVVCAPVVASIIDKIYNGIPTTYGLKWKSGESSPLKNGRRRGIQRPEVQHGKPIVYPKGRVVVKTSMLAKSFLRGTQVDVGSPALDVIMASDGLLDNKGVKYDYETSQEQHSPSYNDFRNEYRYSSYSGDVSPPLPLNMEVRVCLRRDRHLFSKLTVDMTLCATCLYIVYSESDFGPRAVMALLSCLITCIVISSTATEAVLLHECMWLQCLIIAGIVNLVVFCFSLYPILAMLIGSGSYPIRFIIPAFTLILIAFPSLVIATRNVARMDNEYR